MIAYKEEDRPNIQQILEDTWFDEIKNLNEIQQQNLENEVKNKFIEKENDVNTILEYNPNILNQFETFISTTRAFGDETKIYFNQDLCTEALLIQETEWRIYLREKLPGDLFRQALWHGGRSGKRK